MKIFLSSLSLELLIYAKCSAHTKCEHLLLYLSLSLSVNHLIVLTFFLKNVYSDHFSFVVGHFILAKLQAICCAASLLFN